MVNSSCENEKEETDIRNSGRRNSRDKVPFSNRREEVPSSNRREENSIVNSSRENENEDTNPTRNSRKE